MVSKTHNGTRLCGKCESVLPLDRFTILKSREGKPTPHDCYCKPCRSRRTKQGQRKRAEKDGPAATKRREANANLKRNYGITVNEYDEVLSAQGGVCAICGTDSPRGKGRFSVDHDHDTGQVRGLLCTCCNTGIGMFEDSVANLASAINYLNRHVG